MNTLQLYISKSTASVVKLTEINGSDEGRRAASDMKSAVAMLDYPASAKLVFPIIVNTADGYAIHIVRTIPPSRPNHLDATIFVNKKLDVMAEDLIDVIDKVTEIVLAKSVTEDDMTRLRKLFAQEFDLHDKTPRVKASRGNEYAFLHYGDESVRTLSDIISDGLYRPEWSDFKGVVLLDDTISPFTGSMCDLDNQPDIDDEIATTEIDTTHSYTFALPVVTPDGHSLLEFELESSKPLKASPVAGYETSGCPREGAELTNTLHRSRGKTFFERIERWLWGLGGFFLGVFIMWIAGLFSGDKTDASSPSSEIETSTTQQPVAADEAVSYLDSNRIWAKSDMERIDGLSGLFDDLNNFRLDEITGKWADRLSKSQNFSKVVKAAKKSVSKKVDPRRSADHNPTYNREGDTRISWTGYTYWIDP